MKKLIMLYFFLAGGIAANTKNIDYTYLKMQSAPFEVDDDYLSKHDIVYFSPTQLEAEGFPMGNGDIGGMVWNHCRRLYKGEYPAAHGRPVQADAGGGLRRQRDLRGI